MRKEEDVKNLVSATVSFYGGLNFAVNNAGVDKGGRMTDLEVSDFDDALPPISGVCGSAQSMLWRTCKTMVGVR